MFLAGTHELTIDAKHRLSIPFAIRRKVDEERDGQSFYVVPGRQRRTLALYPEKHYERMRADLPEDESLSDEAYKWRQFEFSQSALLRPDDQGRVLIPERLLKHAEIEKEVALLAIRDHLELWRRDDFEAFEQAMWPHYEQKRADAVREMRDLASPNGKEARDTADGAADQR